MNDQEDLIKTVVKLSRYTIYMACIALACIGIVILSLSDIGSAVILKKGTSTALHDSLTFSASVSDTVEPRNSTTNAWTPPAENTIPAGKAGETIRYGRELLAHTAKYFGPKGSIATITNGMNCQNCHLEAGTKLFANSYAAFIASYPKVSNRSGRMTQPAERIAECFERSLAGKVPDTAGREVQAILAYMKWVGKDVRKGQKIPGSATEKLRFLDRAADPEKGKAVFTAKCQSCHGANGEGIFAADKITYTFPPLWGKHSYNDGAGMYRLSNFAGFVKNNMPFGASHQSPQLTDEEAWNVAAFVNTQPRPHRDQHKDWADLKKKPIDFPFGPYADIFSEKQHKLGPFKPIKDAHQDLTDTK